jgi:hypothetical protein
MDHDVEACTASRSQRIMDGSSSRGRDEGESEALIVAKSRYPMSLVVEWRFVSA